MCAALWRSGVVGIVSLVTSRTAPQRGHLISTRPLNNPRASSLLQPHLISPIASLLQFWARRLHLAARAVVGPWSACRHILHDGAAFALAGLEPAATRLAFEVTEIYTTQKLREKSETVFFTKRSNRFLHHACAH